MAQNKQNHDFLLQGSTLAMAAVLGRIIGLIYRIPLTAIIGDLGNNYYGCAFDIYNIMLLISSYSLPMAVSRLVSNYRTRGEMTNAYRVLQCAFVFALVVGGIVCTAVFAGAGYITDVVFQTPLSKYALRVLAPVLVITALLGVFRGYFQGMERMRPSAASQVLEQLINAFISVAAAYLLALYGLHLEETGVKENGYEAAYGAAGASLGTLAGAAASLIFLLFFSMKPWRIMRGQIKQEQAEPASYRMLLKSMLLTVFPILAASAFYNINIVIEQGIFKHMMKNMLAKDEIALLWGIFSGKFKTLVNFPVAIATAIGAACIPGITASFTAKDEEHVSEKTGLTIRFSMLIAFPSAFGLMFLAYPVMQLLFQDNGGLAARLLFWGGFVIVFYSLSTVAASILQGIGKLRAPVINSAISLGAEVAVLMLLLKFTNLGIYAVVFAMFVFGICAAVLNQIALYRSGYWEPKWQKDFLRPAVCALVMAAVSRLVEIVFEKLLPLSIVLPCAAAAGIFVYFLLLIALKALAPEAFGKKIF